MFVVKGHAHVKTKRYTELLLFSLQLRIANAANGQITKRNKLDVFQLFAINHDYHSSQPKSTCGNNMAILLYTIGITEHLVLKIVAPEQSQTYCGSK